MNVLCKNFIPLQQVYVKLLCGFCEEVELLVVPEEKSGDQQSLWDLLCGNSDYLHQISSQAVL